MSTDGGEERVIGNNEALRDNRRDILYVLT